MATSVLATLVSPDGRRDEVLAALEDLRSAAEAHEPGTLLFTINELRNLRGPSRGRCPSIQRSHGTLPCCASGAGHSTDTDLHESRRVRPSDT